MTVSRGWTRHDLQARRFRQLLAEQDPDFERKAADIIGLLSASIFSPKW
jgi:hypothetical protein